MAVKYSDIIVLPSEETKKELASVFRAKENKIRAIMHGPYPMFRDGGRLREKFNRIRRNADREEECNSRPEVFKIFTKMPGTMGTDS